MIIVASEQAKENFLNTVYPHNIDCIVLTQQEAQEYKGDYKIVFFGCFVKELAHCENLIMDDIVYTSWSPKPYSVRWEPESLATFLGCWFNQGKLRKMKNNQTWRFENGKPTDGRFEWLKNIMT